MTSSISNNGFSAFTVQVEPIRPQTNPQDAIYWWLENVNQHADCAASEDIASLAELAQTAPKQLPDDAKLLSEVIDLVKQVASTKKFNRDLAPKVQSALELFGK